MTACGLTVCALETHYYQMVRFYVENGAPWYSPYSQANLAYEQHRSARCRSMEGIFQ